MKTRLIITTAAKDLRDTTGNLTETLGLGLTTSTMVLRDTTALAPAAINAVRTGTVPTLKTLGRGFMDLTLGLAMPKKHKDEVVLIRGAINPANARAAVESGALIDLGQKVSNFVADLWEDDADDTITIKRSELAGMKAVDCQRMARS